MRSLRDGAGFTIIEVMLFLGVSTALGVGILATASTGINSQRYQDAANSFKNLVQEQFTYTTSVVNSPRPDKNACPISGTGGPAQAGATDCIVMGRLMAIDSAGGITTFNLLGKDLGVATPTTDEAAISASTPTIDTISQTNDSMNWGTAPYKAGSTQSVTIVVFRSPSSGNILAYVDHTQAITSQTQLTHFISGPLSNSTDQSICIDAGGWTIAARQVVVIGAQAAGPSAVELRPQQGAECA